MNALKIRIEFPTELWVWTNILIFIFANILELSMLNTYYACTGI